MSAESIGSGNDQPRKTTGFERSVIAVGTILSRASLAITGALIVAMMLLVCFDVLLRSVTGRSTNVAVEYSAYLLVAATFVGGGYSLREGAFLRVRILFDRMKPRVQSILQLVFNLVGILYVSVLLYAAWLLVSTSFSLGTRSSFLSATPLWVPQSVMLLGLAYMLLVLIEQVVIGSGRIARNEGEPRSADDSV